jgi:hypothetical protein
MESKEDEIAPVIRPNLKILFFNLRFGMPNSEKCYFHISRITAREGYNIKDAEDIFEYRN